MIGLGAGGQVQYQRESACAFPWEIANKYYTAQLSIFTAPSADLIEQEVAKEAGALILVINSNEVWVRICFALIIKDSPLLGAETWSPFLEAHQPELILAVDVGSNRSAVLDWCLDHQCEHIFLAPTDEDEGDKKIQPLTSF